MSIVTIALEKVDFLPPDRVTDDTSILTLKNMVLEPFCRWEDGSFRPGLFSHWTCENEARRWRFHIRPDAVFHDGKPAVAEDVLAFISAIIASVDTFGMKWSYARYFERTRFSAHSDSEIDVEMVEPFGDLPEVFSEFFLCRLASDGKPVLGTGPYRVAEFDGPGRVLLERNSGSGPERMLVVAERSADIRFASLKSGAIDVALNLERMDGRIDFDPAFHWGRAVNTLSIMCYLNCFQGIFKTPEARLAINYAVDVPGIIDGLFQGLGVPSGSIVSPHHLGSKVAALSPIPFDPDKAKALFEQAGLDGPILIRTPEFMPEKAVEICQVIGQSLAAIDVPAILDIQPDRPAYAREVSAGKIGDMAIFDSSPHSTYRVLNDKISSRTKALWWQGFIDPELEDLIANANRSVTEFDREQAYGRCLVRLNQNPPWLYLFHPVNVFASQKKSGFFSIDSKGVLRVFP